MSIVNLSSPAAFWILTDLLSALTTRPSVIVVNRLISAVPFTVKLSSTIVSPVAESIVKLPREVSISEDPLTPI